MSVPRWLKPSPEEAFWRKVHKLSPLKCWLWVGQVQTGGAGMASYRGRLWKAHRLAYVLVKGPIPDGMTIDHLCRVRLCCNPAHLEAVTQSENYRRNSWTLAQRRRRFWQLMSGEEGEAVLEMTLWKDIAS